jgi:hypothetical protein
LQLSFSRVDQARSCRQSDIVADIAAIEAARLCSTNVISWMEQCELEAVGSAAIKSEHAPQLRSLKTGSRLPRGKLRCFARSPREDPARAEGLFRTTAQFRNAIASIRRTTLPTYREYCRRRARAASRLIGAAHAATMSKYERRRGRPGRRDRSAPFRKGELLSPGGVGPKERCVRTRSGKA